MKYWEEILACLLGLGFSGLILFTINAGIKYGRPDLVMGVVPALVFAVIMFGFVDDFYE